MLGEQFFSHIWWEQATF